MEKIWYNRIGRRMSRHPASGYKGVLWCERARKWRVQIYVRVIKQNCHVGLYNTIKQAIVAYSEAEQRYYKKDIKVNKE